MTGDVRFVAHDELRYQLRSVVSCVPWIRRLVLVVSDVQTLPRWLDTTSPRLRIVRHSEFIPASCLPTFSSLVMEYFLHRIPGLSSSFLYANDDMFLLRPLRRDYFFSRRDGYPFYRFSADYSSFSPKNLWRIGLECADRLVEDRFGCRGKLFEAHGLAPHHGFDGYLKADCSAFGECFEEEISQVSAFPFRTETQFQRKAISNYALAVGHGHVVRVKRRFCERLSRTFLRPLLGTWCTTAYCQVGDDLRAEIARCGKPFEMVLNDKAGATPEEYAQAEVFLQELYPHPSEFEKP